MARCVHPPEPLEHTLWGRTELHMRCATHLDCLAGAAMLGKHLAHVLMCAQPGHAGQVAHHRPGERPCGSMISSGGAHAAPVDRTGHSGAHPNRGPARMMRTWHVAPAPQAPCIGDQHLKHIAGAGCTHGYISWWSRGGAAAAKPGSTHHGCNSSRRGGQEAAACCKHDGSGFSPLQDLLVCPTMSNNQVCGLCWTVYASFLPERCP